MTYTVLGQRVQGALVGVPHGEAYEELVPGDTGY